LRWIAYLPGSSSEGRSAEGTNKFGLFAGLFAWLILVCGFGPLAAYPPQTWGKKAAREGNCMLTSFLVCSLMQVSKLVGGFCQKKRVLLQSEKKETRRGGGRWVGGLEFPFRPLIPKTLSHDNGDDEGAQTGRAWITMSIFLVALGARNSNSNMVNSKKARLETKKQKARTSTN
jgi:hypothetical protein